MNSLPVELIQMIYDFHNPHKEIYNSIIRSMNESIENKRVRARHTLCMFELDYLNEEYNGELIQAVQDIENFIEEHNIQDIYGNWIFNYLNHLDNIYDFNDNIVNKIKEDFLNCLNY